MTVISELTRLERFIYQLLTGDGTVAGIIGTRCYAGIGPQSNATFPYVVYTMISPGEDARGAGATRIMARPLYLIEAVGMSGSVATLQTLADRMETLLQGIRGGTADATIQFCHREGPHRLTTVEPPGSTVYQHIGGRWRFGVSPLVNP